MINNKNKFIGIFLVLILSINLVYAIGVGSSYSRDNPLEMYAGESRTIYLDLDNNDISSGVNLEGVLIEGEEVADLDNGPYLVAQNEVIRAEMNVKVPAGASIGDVYSVRYEFKQVEGEDGEGGAAFAQSIIRKFNVNVIEKPADVEEISMMWWILGGIVLVIVVIIIWFAVKGKQDTEMPVEKTSEPVMKK